MKGLGPEAKAFLDAARLGDEPKADDRERVRAAIALRIGIGAAGAVGLTGGSRPVGPVLKTVASKMAVAALISAIAIGSSAWFVLRGPPPFAPLEARERSPVKPVAIVPTNGPVYDTASQAKVPAASTTVPSRPPPTNASVPTLAASAPIPVRVRGLGEVAAEAHLLAEAQTAMRAGDAGLALALVEDHARRYPKGALGEERDATRIAALCALGHVADAQDAAARFLRIAPLSPLAGRVRASCGAGSTTTTAPTHPF